MRRDSNIAVSRFTGRIQRHFVPRFYHDRRNSNFRRGLTFVGEKKEIDEVGFLTQNLEENCTNTREKVIKIQEIFIQKI